MTQAKKKPVDWPGVFKAWALENGAILLLAQFRYWLVPIPEQYVVWQQFIYGLVGSWFTVEGGMIMHLVMSKYVYKDTPYLSRSPFKNEQGLWDTLVSWFWCNCVANVVALALLIPVIMDGIPLLNLIAQTS
eukprot:TRINITY_DN2999_c0_g2_i4.p1 TRINITY_DN2999_c0_g2~~TRINITY_DN2999_c0_g2_i4.p1  ORF type:complete len:145 (+),score=20.14 TRINITY_DN2999_c0_g2_i4:42-437(+)